MTQQRNFTIDFLRLIMAFLIVALHSNPFAEYSALISYFPSQILSRLGVPFFATVAGYYFFKNTSSYKSTIKKYFYRYSLWNAIYFAFQYILTSFLGGGGGHVVAFECFDNVLL